MAQALIKQTLARCIKLQNVVAALAAKGASPEIDNGYAHSGPAMNTFLATCYLCGLV